MLRVDAGIHPWELDEYTDSEILRILHLLSVRADAGSEEYSERVQTADRQSKDAAGWLLRDKG